MDDFQLDAAVSEPVVQVKEPMGVVWQGVEYPVAAWNVHGFVLDKAIPRILTPGHGRVADFTILIGPRGTRIEMQVQARAEDSGEAQPLAFRFVDLQRAQAEVLHRLVDHAVNKKAVSLTRLLNETEVTRQERQETVRRTTEARKWLQLSLAGLVLAGATTALWTRLTTVPARYAAVTAAASVIAPPAAGLVGSINVREGQQVAVGDVIGHIRVPDNDRRAQALADELSRLEAERAELLVRRGAVEQIGALTTGPLGTERERLTSALALAERRLGVEREMLAALRGTGLPTARRMAERAEQESRVLAAEQDLLTARLALDALAQTEALAQVGVLPGLGASALGTTEATDLRLQQIDQRIADLRRGPGAAGEALLATCDCTVLRLERRVGELSDPARPLAILVENQAPTVHALILGEHARSLRAGDRASIDLADGTSLSGRVGRIDYNAHWAGFAGLQDNVFAADRYARVEVLPDQRLSAPVGMTASVSVSTDRWLSPLLSMVGL